MANLRYDSGSRVMKSRKSDPLYPELRSVERKIDNYYKQNPLARRPFAVGAWHFMAFCEDTIVMEFLRGEKMSIQDSAVLADNLVNHMQYPLLWLRTSCPPGGQVPFSYDEDSYQAALELFKLGEDYEAFRIAFTYASQGLIDLELQGSAIVPSHDLSADARYEAYDRLVKPTYTLPDFEQDDLVELIRRSLKVSGDRFEYKLNPRTVKLALEVLSPLDSIFTLPDDWQFSNYSMGEFRRVFMVLIAIAYIHFIARLMAASQGCMGLGYSYSLFVLTYDELLRRIVRYSRVPETVVSHLLDDLTYGSGGISRPDPAIQPLIKLNDNQYGYHAESFY